MFTFSGKNSKGCQGFALILVLCFMALLSMVVLAFFSNAGLQRSISDSSATQTKASLFALGAVDTIVGDLKQEIVAGSTVTAVYTNPTTGVTNFIYTPSTNLTMVPAISGFTTNVGLENLVKISSPTNFYPTNGSLGYNLSTYPLANRATTNSSTNVSLNGRYVSAVRWNKPMLIARLNATSSKTDLTPVNAFATNLPSWILVDRSGSNPIAWSPNMQWSSTNSVNVTNTSLVIGRYAYAIYNEGGLLDANVAGYPQTGTALTTNVPYKNAEAFADLAQLTNSSGQILVTANISTLLNWRNAATLGIDATGTNYVNYVLANLTGFLHPSSTNLTGTGQSDSMFASRQQLIDFFNNKLNSARSPYPIDALPYLSTFTRGLDQPSYAPDTNRPLVQSGTGGNNAVGSDQGINPAFLMNRVTGSSFIRNNGTQASLGDPLLKNALRSIGLPG